MRSDKTRCSADDYLTTLASASRFQSAPSNSGRMWAAITLDFLGMLTVKRRLGLGGNNLVSLSLSTREISQYYLLTNMRELRDRSMWMLMFASDLFWMTKVTLWSVTSL